MADKPDKPLGFTEVVNAVGVVAALYETELELWGTKADLKDKEIFNLCRDRLSLLIQYRAMGGELPSGAIASCQVIAHVILAKLRSYQSDQVMSTETMKFLAYDIVESTDKWPNLYDFSRFSKT